MISIYFNLFKNSFHKKLKKKLIEAESNLKRMHIDLSKLEKGVSTTVIIILKFLFKNQ